MIAITCTDCQTPKALGDFTPGQQVKSAPRCKSCVRVRNCKYRAENQDALRSKQAAHYHANKDVILEKAKHRWLERKDLYQPARQRWAADHRHEMLGYYQKKGSDFRVWVDSLKQDVPCMDCKGQFPPYVMEYDHVREGKRHNIGKMSNHKRERVLEEITKCELICCACHRVRSHARRQVPQTARLLVFRAWINTLKVRPCTDCGKTLLPEAMDFDHVAGVKVKEISDMWSWGREKVLTEIAKCELVCANCHRIRTVETLRAEDKEAA